MKKICAILWMCIAFATTWAQDSAATREKWEINGYIKDMQSLRVDRNPDQLVSGNLVHNRINLKWLPLERATITAALRNRIFWGDDVRTTPYFVRLLRNENDWVNLSAVWTSRSNFVFQSNVERLWAEFRRPKWNLRLGRQRINWGVTTTWNPNDIFNTYNFLDFDYEERPGSDALKYQYLFSDFSNIEVAVSPSDNIRKSIAASRFYINRWGYDIQIITGYYRNRFTAGFGWAGSLGNIGYKGEGQAFFADKDSSGSFSCSMELGYAFKNAWYVGGSVLYNTIGIHEAVSDWSKLSFRISPANLMPARWSVVTTTSKEFTPLFSGNLTLVYSPEVNLFIIYPSFRYNLATNLDADLISQSFFLEQGNRFQAVNHRLFLRLKWSF